MNELKHNWEHAAEAPVLNVNDSEAVRYMTSRMLRHAGFRVIEAGTGREALELVKSQMPRLVVLDVKLPDMNGLEVCSRIKAAPETQGIKVLHTSAVFVSPEYKVQSLDSGADGYLTHPFEQEELIATARSLLRLSETEKNLRNTAAELRTANKRIHEFLAMLGHELRNPLSAIATCLPLLERNAARDTIEGNAREVIQRQTLQLRRLVDDLLDVARVTQGKIEPQWERVDLSSLLAKIADNIRRTRTAACNQTLTVLLPHRPLYVRGDSLRLEQIFSNLLDNASKYSEHGGEIFLSATVLERGSGDDVRVLVRDNGIGITAEALPGIFALFAQADVPLARSRGGLGIGLTLVKSLVEIHGGTVRARSAGAGKGSELEVTLPLLSEQNAADSQTAAQPDAAPGNESRKIAVVEDNPDVQVTLKTLLESWGHSVQAAADGRAGIDIIRNSVPDLAFVDIGLPFVDGYEVARQVRACPQGKQVYLVALTGYGTQDQKERALRCGFDLHMPKPAEPEQLAALIRDLSKSIQERRVST